ncbi:MAG TPA: hypothetical protein VKV74_02750 [Bryobacteraceae bacterium]|nr:hypothetical protein [Bryobacteraceae bacterium]
MAALAENFGQPKIIRRMQQDWALEVRAACAKALGFDPDLRLNEAGEIWMGRGSETLVIPTALDMSLWEREAMGERVAEARRGDKAVFHDDVDPGHPLVVQALALQAACALREAAFQKCGLILAASGQGDPASRAQTYRLLRLLWEQCGFARGEAGFVRHGQPFLGHVLDRCAREPMSWVVVFQSQWPTEHMDFARVMVENACRSQPGATIFFADPPGAHPLLTAWASQRILRLWHARQARAVARAPSLRRAPSGQSIQRIGKGWIARNALGEALERILPAAKPERILVKVTWHGYATGAYTDPAALDLLLSALPARAIVLEGHTSSRNLGGAAFDWETEPRQNRAWIRQQEAEYLRRTGLQEVLARRKAEYVNVTEEFWNEEAECDPAAFVPRVLLELEGNPMLSFAKFKGPTRLGISNMFGLIPSPLRSAWHGPNITWFAKACCAMTKLYARHFELCGVVEGLYSAVRWNRKGLYRSRWGNYDLIRDAGYVAASRGLASADILAARLQGQDAYKSAFFDVVREELGWDEEAARAELPEEAKMAFA